MNDITTRPKIYVTASDGCTIHYPGGAEQLPSIGAWVEDTSYWRRLERDKDVVISLEEPTPASLPTPKKTTKDA